MESGTVGMSLSLIMKLVLAIQWGMRQTAELENNMTSMERIIEYIDLEPEDDIIVEDQKLDHWPKTGKIEFSNLTMKYSAYSKATLKGLNLEINSGEKIGKTFIPIGFHREGDRLTSSITSNGAHFLVFSQESLAAPVPARVPSSKPSSVWPTTRERSKSTALTLPKCRWTFCVATSPPYRRMRSYSPARCAIIWTHTKRNRTTSCGTLSTRSSYGPWSVACRTAWTSRSSRMAATSAWANGS